jgi:hypothetical protein
MLSNSEESLLAASLNLLFLMILIPASRDALMELRWQGLKHDMYFCFSLINIQLFSYSNSIFINERLIKHFSWFADITQINILVAEIFGLSHSSKGQGLDLQSVISVLSVNTDTDISVQI